MTTQDDVQHFVRLRKSLSEMRREVERTDEPLSDAQRDIVAIAQAEALTDLAATLNAGVTVTNAD